MFTDYWRYRLPNGVTGSALRFSEMEAIGNEPIPKVKFVEDGLPLRPAEELPGLYANTGASIEGELLRAYHQFANIAVTRPDLPPGQYHPRVWRQRELPGLSRVYQKQFASTIQAVSNLFVLGSEVYRYIEPSHENHDAYGHRVREILILACTEVEAAWKAVLVANGKADASSRLGTNQYVKLRSVMRLDEWQVALSNYPGYQPFKPFADWSDSAPSETLPWYAAYNRVKHDREAKFKEAKLGHMIKALGACYVMLVAQFGAPSLYAHDAHYPVPFIITQEPTWDLREQYIPPYFPRGQPQEWAPAPLPIRL